MQIELTNGRLACAFALLWLAACDSAPTSPRTETVAERLALLEQECGFGVSLPIGQSDLEALFTQHGTHTYVVERPLDGSSGDNVFPMEETPELDHGRVVSAVVLICDTPGVQGRPELGARSPRYAFYIDETGTVVHVEDHSLYLG